MKNFYLYRSSVARELSALGITPTGMEPLGTFELPGLLAGDATPWLELSARLHYRMAVLFYYAPFPLGKWLAYEADRDADLATPLGNLVNAALGLPLNLQSHVPWLSVHAVCQEYGLPDISLKLIDHAAERAKPYDVRDLNLAVGIVRDMRAMRLLSERGAGAALGAVSADLYEIIWTGWRAAFVDRLLHLLAMRRSDLRYDEWACALRVIHRLFDESHLSGARWGREPDVRFPEYDMPAEIPAEQKEFWAWRLGQMISSGAHLTSEIRKRLEGSEGFGGVPSMALAVSTLLGARVDGNWDQALTAARRLAEKIWDAELDMNELAGFDDVQSDPYNIRSALYWTTQIGFADGMRDRDRWVSSAAIEAEVSSAGNLTVDLAAIARLQDRAEAEFEQRIAHQLQSTLGINLWGILPQDSRDELVRGERYYARYVDDRHERASQHYVNAVDRALDGWFGSKISWTRENRRPRGLGEWARLLRQMLAGDVPEWRGVDRQSAAELVDLLQHLVSNRPLAHGLSIPIRTTETRNIVLGLQGRSVLLLAARSGALIP